MDDLRWLLLEAQREARAAERTQLVLDVIVVLVGTAILAGIGVIVWRCIP